MNLLLVTSTYPNPRNPARGAFNQDMVRALRTVHDVRVISPVPWTDGFRSSASLTWSTPDNVTYPTYYYPPKLMRAHYGRFYWWSMRSSFRALLRDFRPHAVMGYWAHPDSEAAIAAARLAKVPSIVLVGGSDVRLLTRNPARRAAISRVLRDADQVIAMSRDLADKITRLGVERSRINVIYRAVDRSVFREADRKRAKIQLGLPATGLLFVWAGRLVQVKNPLLLLDAVACWRKRCRTAWQLVIIGDGPLKKRLRRRIGQLGLASNVRLLDSIDHSKLAVWYQAADRTLLTSDSEGIPNVLLESIACGTPFVATDVGGVREVATVALDELCCPGDARAFVRGIQKSVSQINPPPRLFSPGDFSELASRFTRVLDAVTLTNG